MKLTKVSIELNGFHINLKSIINLKTKYLWAIC